MDEFESCMGLFLVGKLVSFTFDLFELPSSTGIMMMLLKVHGIIIVVLQEQGWHAWIRGALQTSMTKS